MEHIGTYRDISGHIRSGTSWEGCDPSQHPQGTAGTLQGGDTGDRARAGTRGDISTGDWGHQHGLARCWGTLVWSHVVLGTLGRDGTGIGDIGTVLGDTGVGSHSAGGHWCGLAQR